MSGNEGLDLEKEVERLETLLTETQEKLATIQRNPMSNEELAESFHRAYEALAPKFGYETREETRKEWKDLPEQNKMLMIAVAGMINEALYRSVLHREMLSLGEVKNGDVIIVRYLKEGLPDKEERMKDYRAIRDWFQMQSLTVRMLGISGDQSLEKTNEVEMAQFGWFKRR